MLLQPFQKWGSVGVGALSYIMGNFMVYQYRLETNLLQLFAQPENSEQFSVSSVITFEVTMLLNRNKNIW